VKPILILGAAGQLGHDLGRTYKGEAPLELRDRSQLDVTDREAAERLLAKLEPSVVINCTAYNLVDDAEKDNGEAAFTLNADAVRRLGGAVARTGAVFVHFSTDYVFGKRRPSEPKLPWKESDVAEPLGAYGRSKLAGEEMARLNPRHFVFRVCGLYGVAGRREKRPNFVERILSLAAQKKKLKIVDDQVLTPSYTLDTAVKVWQVLDKALPQGRFGVYHVTNSGECSFFEFAKTALQLAGVKADLQPTTLAEYGAPAPRPPYSVLAHDGLKALGLDDMPHWKDALKRYLKERGK
jgi:dTDP-4-dehydrorhamnose reductase